MTRHTDTPDVGDIVSIYDPSRDITLIGKVIDLLSTQFTLMIHLPTPLLGKTYFVFYNDEWKYQDEGSLHRGF